MDSLRIRCSLDGDCSFILHKVSTVPDLPLVEGGVSMVQ